MGLSSNQNITLLTEDVSLSKVRNAIKRCKYVEANYESNEDLEGSGNRIIMPVALGKSKSGNLVVRAYQPYGDTKTKIPNWKLFRLDRFVNWEEKNKIFRELPDNFNPNGDKSMSEVLLITDLAGHNEKYDVYAKSGMKPYNDKRHEDAENKPFAQLKKNINKKAPTQLQKIAQYNLDKYGVGSGAKQWINGASAEEMANTTDFGDNDYLQTSQPIVKGQNHNQTQVNNNVSPIKTQKIETDYNTIASNGPVLKGSEEEKNNLENNIDNEENESTTNGNGNK